MKRKKSKIDDDVWNDSQAYHRVDKPPLCIVEIGSFNYSGELYSTQIYRQGSQKACLRC